MKSYIQVITTPTADTNGLSLMLHCYNKRYLVGGMPEGLQRATMQRGLRFVGLSEVFLTGRTQWRNTGGLIGLVLTLADVLSMSAASIKDGLARKAHYKAVRLGFGDDSGRVQQLLDEMTKDSSDNLTIFSPPNLNFQLATARRYVFRKGMPVTIHEIEASSPPELMGQSIEPIWQDSNIKVWPMAILPSTSRPVNPRKRSFEMIDDKASPRNATIISDDMPEHEHHKLMIKSIVSEMFNSSWRLDTLHETRLADVRMPATIFVRNPDDHKIERYQGPVPGGPVALPNPDMTVLVRKPWPGALIESLPPATPAKESLSYIIRGHTVRGKFDPKKAKQLNVAPGPDYSKLTSGVSVVNAEGVTVHPDQVLGPSRPGGGFAIIDLPDESYIDNLITRPEWADSSVMEGVEILFWNCGPDVIANASVKRFMASMPKVKHIVSSAEHCPNQIAFDSSATSITKLQQIDEKRFRTPLHDNIAKEALEDSPNVMLAKTGQIIELEPAIGIVEKNVLQPLDVDRIVRSMHPDVLAEAEAARTAIAADKAELEEWASKIPGKDVEITTLGTGSALPSKYRNVSATLLRVPGWGSMLFDCGESTLGALKRAFPADELKEIIAELKVIVISHMHADHHLGTVSVIKAWYEEVHKLVPAPSARLADRKATSYFEDSPRLAVLAEPAMQSWLHEYSAIEDYGYSRLAPLELLVTRKDISAKLRWYMSPQELKDATNSETNMDVQAKVPPSVLGLSEVQAVSVVHCAGARAVSLTWPDGFKASYSGDCRPSKAFSRIGLNSTVCIHEATFDDELRGDAVAKQHSTTSEALQVAQAMAAKTCVLTHFSQRYQKLPILERASVGETEPITQPLHIADDPETPDDADLDNMPIEDATQGHAHDNKDSLANRDPAEAVKIQLNSDMKVCVAFDLMRVKVSEIAEMQYYTPALLKLLSSDTSDEMTVGDDRKGSKRRN